MNTEKKVFGNLQITWWVATQKWFSDQNWVFQLSNLIGWLGSVQIW